MALAVLAGCRSPSTAVPAPIPDSAQVHLLTGLQLEYSGSRTKALGEYRAAIEEAPEFIEAHRALQNVRLDQQRRGDLIAEYGALLASRPESAAYRYLLARLWSDRARQLAGFEDALEADPRCYFALVGAGYASLELGYDTRAGAYFERALAVEPDRPEALRGRLQWAMRQRGRDAVEVKREIASLVLARWPGDATAERLLLGAADDVKDTDRLEEALRFATRQPSDESAALLLELLEQHGRPRDFDLARARFGAPARSPRDSLDWTLLRAFLDERCGDAGAALERVLVADPAAKDDPRLVLARRRLLLENGDVARYLDEVIEARFGSGFELGDGGAARAELSAVAAALRGGNVADATGAVDALLHHGLLEAGIALARRELERDPAQSAVRSLLDEALQQRHFIAELHDYFERMYRSEDPPPFDATLAELRRLSKMCFDADVVEPAVTRDYFPIGSFLDPDPAHGGGLAKHFDRFGMFFLVGQRVNSPPDGYLLRRIAATRPVVAGRSIWRVVGEDLLIRSRAEAAGVEIAGFAFDSFIALNVDRPRAQAARARALHDALVAEDEDPRDDSQIPATTPAERADLREPGTLAARANFASYASFLDHGGRPQEYPGLLLDAVEAHERAHIVDAATFLPIYRDLRQSLEVLWQERFRVSAVEAWLEQRAQTVALRDARDPLAALADAAAYMPARDVAPPHSAGYFDLVAAMVAEIAAHPSEYPEIDPCCVIVPQLDRLGENGLRRIARRLLESEIGAPSPR